MFIGYISILFTLDEHVATNRLSRNVYCRLFSTCLAGRKRRGAEPSHMPIADDLFGSGTSRANVGAKGAIIGDNLFDSCFTLFAQSVGRARVTLPGFNELNRDVANTRCGWFSFGWANESYRWRLRLEFYERFVSVMNLLIGQVCLFSRILFFKVQRQFETGGGYRSRFHFRTRDVDRSREAGLMF